MSYSNAYSSAYVGGTLVWYKISGSSLIEGERQQRPKYLPYPTLWERYKYPTSPVGLFLWKDGTVKVVESLYEDGWDTADRIIQGGYVLTVRSDDWEVPVLQNAGYILEYVGSGR